MGINLSKGATDPTKCCSNLPDPILAEIISRLPIQSILQCMCVCKTWFQLISSNHFNNCLLKKRSHVTFILHTLDSKYYFCEIEPRSNNTKALGPIKPMMLKTKLDVPYFKFFSIIGICNGLICLLGLRHFIHIWNPMLGEYITFSVEVKNDVIGNYGFGYCEVTKQYKVLIIVRREIFEAEVLTVGSNTWRRAGNVHCHPKKRFSFCCFKGTLHWICGCGDSHSEWLCCFDIGTEQQRSISPPPDCTDKSKGLRVVRDCLCIVIFTFTGIVLWSMKDYGVAESWTKHIFIDLSGSFDPMDIDVVTTLWEDKEILILEYYGCLAYYDYKEMQYVKLKTTIDDGRIRKGSAYAYFPSFVPLSALIKEEPSKTVITQRDGGCFGFFLSILRNYI